MDPRILVVGAGAVGCLVGGLLTRAGRDVTLVDQWPEHVETMRRRGLRLSGTCGEHLVPVRALHLHELQGVAEAFDAAFIAVKGYDTEWAAAMALRQLRPDGVVVDFQNGLNDERVAAVVGKERTLGCVILLGAGLYEPGHAMRTDTAPLGFRVGELDGADTKRVRRLAALLADVAPAKVTTNLMGERWSKLALNCMLNALAALTGFGTAEVRTDPGTRRIAVHLGAETILVGRASGYEVEPILGIAPQRYVEAAAGRGLESVEADVSRDAASRAGGRPSMLQDVMRGRRTEIEQLNGEVVVRGRRLGVPTPFNEAVVRLVAGQPVGALKPDPARIAPLLAMLERAR